jgi:hypothetical protein
MPNTNTQLAETVHLSEAAVANLRFRIKGFPLREQDRPAYRELVAAGIMESTSGAEYRFTAWGLANREEILRTEEDRIERERYAPPDGDLSDAARVLLRACVAGPIPEGDESNRPAFRQLVKARVMISVGTFTKGDDCVFRWTYWGYKMRFELAGIARAKDSA